MRLLTRYVLRAHVAPFLFAFTTITGLLFLNAVAQRLQDLTGKGLGWRTLLEFMVLSLPHTVALTLPMAILVAVLYAFAELTTHNEITAMKAGGVRPQRLLVPLLGVGILLAELMFVFHDRVLPEANHRLKELLVDIARKSPTFELREQIVNEIRASDGTHPVFLKADRIDPATNRLTDVVIYSEARGSHRTTFAETGSMAFNATRTDLFLTLEDGLVLETDPAEPSGFRQMSFTRQVLPLRGIGNELERRAGEGSRGDRELSIAMMQDRVADAQDDLERALADSRAHARDALLQALGRSPTPGAVAVPDIDPRTGAVIGEQLVSPSAWTDDRTRDWVADAALTNARTAAARVDAARQTINMYRVEIHKKYALSFACVVFVLIGAPLALRYPRGGMGLVITASSAIFAVSWSGLIGGEGLADRGLAPPALAMWAPNLIFLVLGVWLASRMGRESASLRGGGWEELVWSLRERWARRRRPAEVG